MWTFGRKLAAGFALCFVMLLGIGITAYRAVDTLTETSHSVAHTHDVLDRIAAVLTLLKDAETGQRGYVITGDDAFLEPYLAGSAGVASAMQQLRELTVDDRAHQQRLGDLEPLVAEKLAELNRTVEMRGRDGFDATRAVVASGAGKRAMDEIRLLMGRMELDERALLDQRAQDVAATTAGTRTTIIVVTLMCIVLVTASGLSITRSVSQEVGGAVQSVQSSSLELQTAANQQVDVTTEQTSAMNEIATTINELLVTSNTIAESAGRVSRIAADTARSAKKGDGTVAQANASILLIRKQINLVVGQMVELGKKSQQIGGVVEIVAELAEQTNILAINATIEAAGAGEDGRRFAVVADEIRKLADRVAGSAKEIRELIDDVRGAVNTTVTTTEGGSKSVDAGTRSFGEVAAAFEEIGGLVVTTTAASREIELSTKQQATAVEQVKIAITGIAQATHQSENSSRETLRTAAELNGLSRGLLRLIQPSAD